MKRVLMIAFHFPPLAGSSGIQRTLRFARYLPEFGWQPIVLTAHPRAYPFTSDDQLADIPVDVEVVRAPAWDASRHFSITGGYPGYLARPDRWLTWWPGAVWSGLRAIRRLHPDVIWSTYPIATAHMIGATLVRLSHLPWIADFRDPMAQEGYPEDPATWKRFKQIERDAVGRATISTFTTPSAMRSYQQRYPTRADHMMLIENGYDEQTFDGTVPAEPLNPGCLTLLHSGVVYPKERDPTHLIQALAQLKDAHPTLYEKLRLRFRAPVHVELLSQLAQRHGVMDAVEILPSVGYRHALQEMRCADGLLILQAENCNEQIPAKFYEYLRAGKPILVLTDPSGDTAEVARGAGIQSIAALDNTAHIMRCLEQFMEYPVTGTLPTSAAIATASRRERTRQLADLLQKACDATWI